MRRAPVEFGTAPPGAEAKANKETCAMDLFSGVQLSCHAARRAPAQSWPLTTG